MRRLPVYFLLDVSESMVGAPLRQLETGMEQIVRSLRTDPHALETVYLSVIAFAGKAGTIAPLIDLVNFYPPRLPIGSGTALGDGLNVLMDSIEQNVVKTTPNRRGDWKPVAFLLTDGKPTDDIAAGITRWKNEFTSRAQLVAITFGDHTDTRALSQLTEHVLRFEGTSDQEFRTFIDWVSNSVTATSHAVDTPANTGVTLAKAPNGLTLVKDMPSHQGEVDENVVVLTGRCQQSKRPYLIKYNRDFTHEFNADSYILEGAFPVDETYFTWSATGHVDSCIGTQQLEGFPPCPHCGAMTAFSQCRCGNLLCTNGPGEFECPWCGSEGVFLASEGGRADFDVTRGRG